MGEYVRAKLVDPPVALLTDAPARPIAGQRRYRLGLGKIEGQRQLATAGAWLALSLFGQRAYATIELNGSVAFVTTRLHARDQPAGWTVSRCPMNGDRGVVVPADANLGLVFAAPAGAE